MHGSAALRGFRPDRRRNRAGQRVGALALARNRQTVADFPKGLVDRTERRSAPRGAGLGVAGLTVDLSRLVAEGAALARMALRAWAGVAGIKLGETASDARITRADKEL